VIRPERKACGTMEKRLLTPCDRQSDAKRAAPDTRVLCLSPDAITEVASDASGVGVKYDLAPDLSTVDDF